MTTVALAVCFALSARADSLSRDLGSPSFRERESAQAQLLAIGAPALPAVKRAVDSPDPEVARRARGLMKDVQFRVDCQRLLAGTPVRLEFTDAPLPVVLLELSLQSGYAVGVANWNPEWDRVKLTIPARNVPFWSAVEVVGKSAGLTVAPFGAATSDPKYFVPNAGPPPRTPGEKCAAGLIELDGLIRFSQSLDAQARGVLEVYRNDLKHYADAVVTIEKAIAEKKADPMAPQTVVKLAGQAENILKAARNLYAAAGVRLPIGPSGRYPVVLVPAAGPTGRGSAGVWVEPTALAPPAAVRPGGRPSAAPPAGPTVHLRVMPEPRIDWVRTTGIRVDRAVDDLGRTVVADLTTARRTSPTPDDMVFLGGGRVIRTMSDDGPVRPANPYSASVLLKDELPAPTSLAEFRGAIQGIVRADSRAVVSQALTLSPKPAVGVQPRANPQRAVLERITREPVSQSSTPVLAASMVQVSEQFVLDVTLSFSGDQFTVAKDVLLNPNHGVQLIVAGAGGRPLVQTTGRGQLGGNQAFAVHGLRVTDGAGKPFPLTGTMDLSRVAADGTGPAMMHFTLTATAGEGTKGPPAKIAWHASRLAPVEVPFDLTRVPVTK